MLDGKKVKELREAQGLSQQALADKAGIAKGTLQTFELNKGNPSLKKIQAIADALGVEISAFEDKGESRGTIRKRRI